MSPSGPSEHILFDPTPEIFATDNQGAFTFPLTRESGPQVATGPYDEVRIVASIWHPSGQRSIDLDRAYVEICGCFDRAEEHWFKLAEIEPVVPPYGADSFDGWIVLPVFAGESAFSLTGSGFEPRARIQLRVSAYLVS